MTHRFIEFAILLIFGLGGNHVAAQAPTHFPVGVKHIKILSTLNSPVPAAKPQLQPVYIPPPPPPPGPVVSCGSDSLMAKIYQLESGCNTAAHNPGGCRGLGQACPGSKLPCSDNDWGCQDAWFRNYAVSAYGSIYSAYLFRISHNWW